MKKIHCKIIFLLILLIITINGKSQNIHIKTIQENIRVLEDTTFTKDVSIIVNESNEILNFPIFYDNELEKISDIKFFIKKGDRFKIVKNPTITENNVDFEQISSKKIKSILIPAGSEANIKYTVVCKELMYFPDIKLFSYDDIDTLRYQILVPESFRLLYNVIYKDSLKYFVLDSLKSGNSMKWNISVVPVKVQPNLLMFFGIYKNIKAPLMRTIVVPAAFSKKGKEYFNNWYNHRVETRRGLDSAAIRKIDDITDGITDPMKIMDTLYGYVKSNFKYVAIEIGMRAFIPVHANEVFINKHGDCKELSNFLSEALNYKGIKSNIAIAATYNHISDCDFPSLGSANHVVCVAYINDKTIILDPTDPVHLPQTPVQSLQDRTILIINPEGGEYYKIKAMPPTQNVIHYDITLKADSIRMFLNGEFKATYYGIAGNFLKHLFLDMNTKDINTNALKHYESVFNNQTVSGLIIDNSKNSIKTEGKISVHDKIFNVDKNQFLFIDFLPHMIETENRETLVEGTFLGNTIDKKVKLRITMDKPFETFNPVKYSFSDKGVSLQVEISNPSDLIIECEYEFISQFLFIDRSNLNIINNILKSFKKITNEPIVLKSK